MKGNIKKCPFDFVTHRNKFFLGSVGLILLGLFCLFIFGWNFGIDFSSGSRVDVYASEQITKEAIRFELETISLHPNEITLAGDQEIAVIKYKGVLSKEEIAKIKTKFIQKYGIEPSVNTVSPQIGIGLVQNTIIAVFLAFIGIFIYMAIRFDLLQALAAVVALIHDVFFMIVLFSMFQLEINITFIAAMLTIIGYSINDTIVTFDRIRENIKNEKKVTNFGELAVIVNKNLTQTFSRSINTAITTVLAVTALLLFGGETLRTFSFALLVGVITGAYSSIFISSQLWMVWKGIQLKKAEQRLLKA